LTPQALAYWLMDDAYKHSSGVSICTESYTEHEVLILVGVFKEKFNLDCTPMKRNANRFRIYVKTKSLDEDGRQTTSSSIGRRFEIISFTLFYPFYGSQVAFIIISSLLLIPPL